MSEPKLTEAEIQQIAKEALERWLKDNGALGYDPYFPERNAYIAGATAQALKAKENEVYLKNCMGEYRQLAERDKRIAELEANPFPGNPAFH